MFNPFAMGTAKSRIHFTMRIRIPRDRGGGKGKMSNDWGLQIVDCRLRIRRQEQVIRVHLAFICGSTMLRGLLFFVVKSNWTRRSPPRAGVPQDCINHYAISVYGKNRGNAHKSLFGKELQPSL